jgi:hypothetical protein
MLESWLFADADSLARAGVPVAQRPPRLAPGPEHVEAVLTSRFSLPPDPVLRNL